MSERIISEFETKANKCKNCMVCQSGEINSDVIKTKMKPILYGVKPCAMEQAYTEWKEGDKYGRKDV